MRRNVLHARLLVGFLLATTAGLVAAGENLVSDPSFEEPKEKDRCPCPVTRPCWRRRAPIRPANSLETDLWWCYRKRVIVPTTGCGRWPDERTRIRATLATIPRPRLSICRCAKAVAATISIVSNSTATTSLLRGVTAESLMQPVEGRCSISRAFHGALSGTASMSEILSHVRPILCAA